MRAGAAVVGVLMFASACTGGGVDAVPWVNRSPASVPPATPSPRPTAAPCRGAQVRLVRTESGGATGHQQTRVVVRNVGEAACTLAGYPELRGTDATGRWVRITTAHGTFFDSPEYEQRPATIGNADEASVNIESSSMCAPFQGPATFDFRALELKLPDGSSLDVPGGYAGTCQPRIGPWYVQVSVPSDARRWPSLRPVIEAPREVKVGSELTYVVTIRNAADKRVRLSPCPAYFQGLGPTKSGGAFELNCAKVRTIEAGKQVRFQMRMRVLNLPPITRPAEGHLEWSIGDGPVAKPRRIRILP